VTDHQPIVEDPDVVALTDGADDDQLCDLVDRDDGGGDGEERRPAPQAG
jgi:hypothetical protein